MQILSTFFKIVFFSLILLGFTSSLYAILPKFICAKPREFSMVKTFNMKGQIDIIGNTVLCKNHGGQCGDPQDGSNNRIYMMYINLDNDRETFNHSSAKIDIPSGAELVWAGLYWQGIFENPTDNQQNLSAKVKFKKEGATYTDVTSIEKKHNWIYLSGGPRWYYQGAAEITDLISDKKNPNGMYTVANIQTMQGKPGGGSYGAWAMVIVYKDDNAPLQNLVVYDGYQGVFNGNSSTTCDGQIKDPQYACEYAKKHAADGCTYTLKATGTANPIQITLDKFLTPLNAPIESSFALFSGEGDIEFSGDTLSLTSLGVSAPVLIGTTGNDKTNPINNLQNSSITKDGKPVLELQPQKRLAGGVAPWANSLGIDIDFFDISHIIKQGQQETEVTLKTTWDGYLPGVFAFSTNLYEPRVCYHQLVFDKNGVKLDKVKTNDTIIVRTWISNIPQSNDTLERAEKVQITMKLDDVNLKYINNSFKMKKFGRPQEQYKVDRQKITWKSSTNTAQLNIGTGANGNKGGYLIPNKARSNDFKVFIEFKAKIKYTSAKNIDIKNIYKVSYKNAGVLDHFFDNLPMKACSDINTKYSTNNLGTFNIVNESGGKGNFTNPKHKQTYLATQVVNKPFNVKIISLNENKNDFINYSSTLILSLIKDPYSSLGNNPTLKQKKAACTGERALWSGNVTFNSDTSKTVRGITYDQAIENVYFRVLTSDGTASCSLDNFAIRPKRFDLSIPSPSQAKKVNIKYKALGEKNNLAKGYDFKLSDLDITSKVKNQLCPVKKLSFTNPTQSTFNDGEALLQNKLLNDVGIFKIEIKEKDANPFAIVDKKDPNTDYINIEAYTRDITIYPNHFKIGTIPNINQNDANFTYYAKSSELEKMALKFDFSVTAENGDDDTTKNYTAGCYSNDTNLVMKFKNIDGADFPSNMDILYKELSTVNSNNKAYSNNKASDENLSIGSIPKNIFGSKGASDGVADFKVRVNFTRDIDKAINPFQVKFEDLDVSDKIHPNASTKNSTIDKNASMFYGRTNSPRSRFSGRTNQQAFIYYEVYCDNTCNKALLLDTDPKYTNDPRWYVNPEHINATFGSPGDVSQKGGTTLVTQTTAARGVIGDFVRLTYDGTKAYPYKTTMKNNASSWLIHNKFKPNATTNEFEVEFEGDIGTWVGKEDTKTTTNSNNAANRINRRSMW